MKTLRDIWPKTWWPRTPPVFTEVTTAVYLPPDCELVTVSEKQDFDKLCAEFPGAVPVMRWVLVNDQDSPLTLSWMHIYFGHRKYGDPPGDVQNPTFPLAVPPRSSVVVRAPLEWISLALKEAGSSGVAHIHGLFEDHAKRLYKTRAIPFPIEDWRSVRVVAGKLRKLEERGTRGKSVDGADSAARLTVTLPVSGKLRAYLERSAADRLQLELNRDANLDSQLNLYLGIGTALLSGWLYLIREIVQMWDLFWQSWFGGIIFVTYGLSLSLCLCYGLRFFAVGLWGAMVARRFTLPMGPQTLRKYGEELYTYYKASQDDVAADTQAEEESRRVYVSQVEGAAETLLRMTNERYQKLTWAKLGIALSVGFLAFGLLCFFVAKVELGDHDRNGVVYVESMFVKQEVNEHVESGAARSGATAFAGGRQAEAGKTKTSGHGRVHKGSEAAVQ